MIDMHKDSDQSMDFEEKPFRNSITARGEAFLSTANFEVPACHAIDSEVQ